MQFRSPRQFRWAALVAIALAQLLTYSSANAAVRRATINAHATRRAADKASDSTRVSPPVVGVVRDEAGQPIPLAQVIVVQLNRVASTNDEGEFRFTGIPAGNYHVTAMRIGYAPAHVDIAVPETGDDVSVSIVMHASAIQISTVQVTATPTGSDPRDLPQAVTTLSGQALSRQIGSSVAQTLSEEPGISVRDNGPAATSPIIRGLQGERVLVLQDGDRASDLSSAAPDHGVSIDPLTAERIEVVRGPASLLYGNQALGGVVNVISNDIPTSIPTHIDGYFATQLESVNPGGGAAGGVTVPVGQGFALVARGGGRHNDPLKEGGGTELLNSFYKNYYGIGGFGFGTNRATGGLIYRGYKFDYGLPSDGSELAKIDGKRNEVVGRTDFTTGNAFVNSVRIGGTAQWYSHAEIDMETGNTNTSFNLKTQTADLLARTHFGAVSGALGASGLFKQYAALGDEALTPAANSNGFGGFFFQELPLANTHGDLDARVPKLQVGGRFDSYRIDIKPGDPKFDPFVGKRNFDQFSGSVGVNVPLGSVVTGAVSLARAFRAPSVEELSSNAMHEAAGTFDVGNPNLKSEVNQGVEGILRVETGRLNGQFSGYYNGIQNFITPNIVKDTVIAGDAGPETVPLNRISQADAVLKGVEGRLEAQVMPNVVLGAMGDMVRGEFKDSKEPLPFMPAARLGGLARFDNGRFSAGAQYRHAFAQNRVPPAVSADDPSGLPTDAYDLLNLSVGYNLVLRGQVNTITFRVDNVLDERYVDATSRLKTFAFNPGRNFALVYRLQF
jgi:iron complex outermembrane receptor protein